MAESDLNYSTDVAREAAHYFLRHRYLTKLGLLYLASVVICVAGMLLAYKFRGTDWFLGFIGTVIGFNIIYQFVMMYSLPRALSKAVSSFSTNRGHIATDDEGFTLSANGNVIKSKWSRFRYVWPREKFIVLGVSFSGGMLHIPTEGLTSNVMAEFEKRATRVLGA